MKTRIFVHCIFLSYCVGMLSGQNLPVITGPRIIDPARQFLPDPFNPSGGSSHESLVNDFMIGKNQEKALMEEVAMHQRYLAEQAQREKDIRMLIKEGFPSLSYIENTQCYYDAFDTILSMLRGKDPLSLSKAVFLTENAYYENVFKYEDFETAVKENVRFCKQKMQEEKLNEQDDLVKNTMLFRFMTDTLQLRSVKGKTGSVHYPMQYDYDDYQSRINYDSHFVTKLMRTSVGQCHSMPLYYLILAEEIGSDAYLAFSPRHSFVKIQDDKGRWYNLELTCKAVLSDAHYMNNSFIKAEAIRSGIYLNPLDKTNAVAEMLVELGRGYYVKYGLDDFVLKCADTAAEYLANDLNALMLKAAYRERLTLTLAYLTQSPKPENLKEKYPDAYKHYEMMNALYRQIDDSGYEELPDDLYAAWLEHIAKEKNKRQKKEDRPFIRILPD